MVVMWALVWTGLQGQRANSRGGLMMMNAAWDSAQAWRCEERPMLLSKDHNSSFLSWSAMSKAYLAFYISLSGIIGSLCVSFYLHQSTGAWVPEVSCHFHHYIYSTQQFPAHNGNALNKIRIEEYSFYLVQNISHLVPLRPTHIFITSFLNEFK